MSTPTLLNDRRGVRQVRALASEFGFHDPSCRGELATLFDGAGRRRKYLRRAGIDVDGFGELLWSRGIVAERPDVNGVLELLARVFDGTAAPRKVRRRTSRRVALAGIDAEATRAKRNRLRKYVCACGAICYASSIVTPEHCGGIPMRRVDPLFAEVMTQTAGVDAVPF